MAGGGTGGHVMPLLAVAAELRRRSHEVVFIGTAAGLESRLVPAGGYRIEYIEIGGLRGLGLARRMATLLQLPKATRRAMSILAEEQPGAVFSLGGYVAAPVVLAAILARVPVVAMEPNAIPGVTNHRLGRWTTRTLLAFPEASAYFPRGTTEVTGLPVREAFFNIEVKPRDRVFHVLVTGGSQGSRTLNHAARDAWPLLERAAAPVTMTLQTGAAAYEEMRATFGGVSVAFLDDMPAAYAAADLIVCRSGAATLAELAAAAKPGILVPYPHAADDHQLHNAEVFGRAGAARIVRDHEMTGERLAQLIVEIASEPERLERMSEAARNLAHEGAAHRAADILVELLT
ncbi:MAG: undecaprenyldiphospho-muramoylpentapeptide beta-N-acetylglucosaminyltransferase, partial [Bryobacteraceae bacterium]